MTVIKALKTWEQNRTDAEFLGLTGTLNAAIAVAREQEAVEVERMNATHENWDTEGWRQYQSEYMVRCPAETVDALRDLNGKLETATELLISPLGTLASSQVALMTGPGGICKSYLTLDAAARRLQRGLPSIVMHGLVAVNVVLARD